MSLTPGRQRAGARLLWALLMLAPLAAAAAELPDADALIRHIDSLWRADSSQARMTMTVRTQRYERSMTLEAWSRGREQSLVVIREPAKDRGVATLKVGGSIWNYLPRINRVSKVPASMMAGAWMGSHFSNDDLVKDSSFERDYRSTLSDAGLRDGRAVIEIRSVARPEAAVVWGSVLTTVDRQSLAPLEQRFLDEHGRLVRTLRFDQLQTVGQRQVPMRLRLQPADKPDESTEIVYQEIRFGVALDDGFFSLQNLQRRQ